MNLDAGFALSDHLDFYELLEVCRTLSPKKTHITHTPNPDVVKHFLEMEGLSASFLDLSMLSEESFDSLSSQGSEGAGSKLSKMDLEEHDG